ncbi:MAG: ABC transporter ATP-binding protein [Chloroflexota bacterium]|nr:ABC transporter ATP-binding protein [Chloroflexota bacterium]MDE2960307.1 ABC transporter ATP-binding protein [Chloroflexota bacterium]
MAEVTAALAAESVVREFGEGDSAVRAVNEVTVSISPGEFVALVGRSGSGKTTLLNLLAGLDRPSSGKVWFEGRELSQMPERELVGLRRDRIGFVFQSFGLIPLLSAFENVELPLHIAGVSWRDRRRRANEALDLVGLTGRSGHRPYELSGGEQQRVAIARALVADPSVLFADEPTGELDSVTGQTIGRIMRDIGASRGVTVVTATHDLLLADMADRRLQMADGRIESVDGALPA